MLGTARAVIEGIFAVFSVFVVTFVQLVEDNILVPRVMGHATGVSPLTVILGILIGAALMGIPGALLAVPVAATIQREPGGPVRVAASLKGRC